MRALRKFVALSILRASAAYLKRQSVDQMVWLNGKFQRLDTGRIVDHTVKTDDFGEPRSLTLFYVSEDFPKRRIRVDLSELKYDYGNRRWHFYRPGTPDPEPRIPRTTT